MLEMDRRARQFNGRSVLGDHLDLQSSALQNLDPTQDEVWMTEVAQEYALLIYDPFPREVAHG